MILYRLFPGLLLQSILICHFHQSYNVGKWFVKAKLPDLKPLTNLQNVTQNCIGNWGWDCFTNMFGCKHNKYRNCYNCTKSVNKLRPLILKEQQKHSTYSKAYLLYTLFMKVLHKLQISKISRFYLNELQLVL